MSVLSPTPSEGDELSSDEVRREHKKLLYLAPVTFALTVVFDLLREQLEAKPWQVALLLIAFGVVMVLGWKRLEGGPDVLVDGRFLALVLGYAVLFAIAANSRLLSWESRITGFDAGVRPNFLALNPLSDWHYWFSRAEPVAGDLLVVTLKASPPALARQLSAELIQSAQLHGAIAVALDFDLTDPRPAVDPQFCRAVEAASHREHAEPMPVYYGRRHEAKGSSRVTQARSLPCLTKENGGHLMAIQDWDRRVRAIPLYYARNKRWSALSFKVAGALQGDLTPRKVDFIIQFLKPYGDVDIRRLEEVKADPGLLTDKVVLAGFGEVDLHHTPFGRLPGVVIHAYSAQALRSGELIHQASRWLSFPVILTTCYLLLMLYLRRTPWCQLLIVTGGLSLLIGVAAAAAMRWGLLWIEVSYPVVAIWLFLAMLLLSRGRLRSQSKVS